MQTNRLLTRITDQRNIFFSGELKWENNCMFLDHTDFMTSKIKNNGQAAKSKHFLG